MTSTNELLEGERAWARFYRQRVRKQLSRRTVLRAGSVAAVLAAGGWSAFIEACSGGDKKPSTGTTGMAVEGVTGPWDFTGTPPYKNGLPDAEAKAPDEWKQYAWIYKYGPWRYNWNVPVTRGGEFRSASAPPANYDVMINGIPSQPFYDKLFNQDIREGVWDGKGLFTKAFNNELAISSEHTPDFASWTFKIPPNVKFHNLPPVNGRLLTAADVVFSFQRHMDTNVIKSTLRQVDKVTAVDDVTVRFDLKQPQLRFPATLASPHLPVFAQEAFDNHDRFITQPIGTGPFVLKSSQYQGQAVWVRNEQYWKLPPHKPEKYGTKPLPLLDKVTRTYYATAVAAREAFYNGEVDEFPGNATDPAIVKDALSRVPNALVNSNGYWSCCPLGILFQYKNPLFQDIRIRQALSLSIDREVVWSQGMQKTGVIIASPVPLDDMGSDFPPPLKDYGPNAQYDPKKAKELLKAAGHDQPLKLQLYAGPRAGSPFEWPLDVIPFMWKQAGIADVTIVTRDSLVLLQDQLDKSFPDMLYPGSLSLPFAFTLDSMVMPAFLTGSPANYGSLSDTTLDGLFDQWSAAGDPAKGQDLARQIAKRFVENVDHVWFTNHGGVDIVQPWLHGCVFTPYAAINYIGMSSNKFMWIDETAPGGRGGKRIA